jgi:hypothetical protein
LAPKATQILGLDTFLAAVMLEDSEIPDDYRFSEVNENLLGETAVTL